jgi:acyl-CoA reductase-like NAD-dependent aldehyde dehydrogenase
MADAAFNDPQAYEELVLILSAEAGKPLYGCFFEQPTCSNLTARSEAFASKHYIYEHAKLACQDEVHEDDETKTTMLLRRPFGVCGIIEPWNFPLMLSFSQIAIAALCGNTIVLKPAETTPLSMLWALEKAKDVFPPGVVNIVSGASKELGKWLTGHPGIDKIYFTGSVATGKQVQKVCSETLKSCTLELGGNDPCVILPCCDAAAIAEPIAQQCLTNSGQTCVNIKRVFVHEDQMDDFCLAMKSVLSTYKVGDCADPEVTHGPLQNKMQFERIISLVEDVRKRGGEIICGGQPTGVGYCYELTLVKNPQDDWPIVAEEQFGPVIPVLAYKDVDEAIRRANDTPYGLSASVWGDDIEECYRVADQIQAGAVTINNHMGVSPWLPHGGMKASGGGRGHGVWGIHEFTQLHLINKLKAKAVDIACQHHVYTTEGAPTGKPLSRIFAGKVYARL